MYPHLANIHSQTGNALLMSLALLGILSVIGVSAMRISITEEKISRNTQDAHLAADAAESGLRIGQQYLISKEYLSSPYGYYISHGVNATAPDLSISAWTNASSYQVTESELDRGNYSSDISDAYTHQEYPRYMIEEFSVTNNKNIGSSLSVAQQKSKSPTYYRIISRGTGLPLGGAPNTPGENEVLLEPIMIERAP